MSNLGNQVFRPSPADAYKTHCVTPCVMPQRMSPTVFVRDSNNGALPSAGDRMACPFVRGWCTELHTESFAPWFEAISDDSVLLHRAIQRVRDILFVFTEDLVPAVEPVRSNRAV